MAHAGDESLTPPVQPPAPGGAGAGAGAGAGSRPVTPIAGVDSGEVATGDANANAAFVKTGKRGAGLAPLAGDDERGGDGTMLRTMSAQTNPVPAAPPPAPVVGVVGPDTPIGDAKTDEPTFNDPDKEEEAFFARTRARLIAVLAFHVDKVNSSMSIKTQANSIIFVASIQLVLGVFTTATAWIQQASVVDTYFSVMAGLVAFVGGCIGIHGARQARKQNAAPNDDRGHGELVFFGLVELWGLTTYTTFLFAGVRDNVSTGTQLCQRATVGLARRVIAGCSDGATWSVIRIIVAVIAVAITTLASYWAFRLKEKLQDAVISAKVEEQVTDIKEHQGSGYFRSHASFYQSRRGSGGGTALPDIGEGVVANIDEDEPAVMQAVDTVLERLSLWFSLDIEKRIMLVKSLCIAQALLSIVALAAVVALADSSIAQNAFTAAVSVFATVIGFVGCQRRDRGAIFLFFVLELWGLSTVTTYLISGVKTERANALTCNELVLTNKASIGSSGSLSQCDSAAVTYLRIIVSLLVLFITLFSSYAASTLDDHIQSDAANKLHSEEYLKASSRALHATNKVGVMNKLLPTKSFASLVGSHANLNL